MADGGEQNSRAFHEVVINDLGRAYLDALLAFDQRGAEVAVCEAIDARLSSSQVDQGIIAPAMWLVGEFSRRGELTRIEERIAGEISVRVMALQREARRGAYARADRRVMLGGDVTAAGAWQLRAALSASGCLRQFDAARRRRARAGVYRGGAAPVPRRGIRTRRPRTDDEPRASRTTRNPHLPARVRDGRSRRRARQPSELQLERTGRRRVSSHARAPSSRNTREAIPLALCGGRC